MIHRNPQPEHHKACQFCSPQIIQRFGEGKTHNEKNENYANCLYISCELQPAIDLDPLTISSVDQDDRA